MAILEFKGALQEWSGARELTADKGVTIDQSLRYLNDNGYEGIYDPLAKALQDGKALAFDASTGGRIGMVDEIQEKAVLVPAMAGGNGGGGATWVLMSTTNFAEGTYLGYQWGPYEKSPYSNFPQEGQWQHRFCVYNGSAWETHYQWVSNEIKGNPGALQLGREGFTAQSSRIDELVVYETTGALIMEPAFTAYGTVPQDQAPAQYPAAVYRGTGRMVDMVVQ